MGERKHLFARVFSFKSENFLGWLATFDGYESKPGIFL